MRPPPIGGPHGDRHLEQTRDEADERAAELANMLSRSLPPGQARNFRVRITEADGTALRLVALIDVP